ncbi:MAG: hypothetical protein IPM69_09500 [Ignavibacteria bacterium]|nr:hypothetical protein [Ignavibacteria bacterium]
MKTNLTLQLDKDILVQAKDFAKDNRVSLSKLIESYLISLTSNPKKKIKISPLVQSLTGVIASEQLDDKNEYHDYLTEKYS